MSPTAATDPRFDFTRGAGPPGSVSTILNPALAKNWWIIALRGVLAILFGIVAFVVPAATILALVLFFSAYMLIDGVFGIAAAVRAARHHERWGLLALQAVASLLAGVIAFLWPG